MRLAVALFLGVSGFAADVDTDWQSVLALDTGPQRPPASPSEARTVILAHLGRQERALRSFLAAHGGDEHAFEAKLRLARLLSMRSEVQGGDGSSRETTQLLAELEKAATPQQRADVEFARIGQTMRTLRQPSAGQRDALLASVRAFQAAHPADPRLAALLAEVATLFDTQLKTKQALLIDAQALASAEDLKARISDDLRRVDLVGHAVPLSFKSGSGLGFDVADYRGKVVLVIFFAVWSQPSTEALDVLQRAVAELPKDRVQLFGVSLDTKPEPLTALVREKKIAWPIVCDGKGWESPLVRPLGVNAVPTVWLLDTEGRLRSLNALRGTVSQVKQLLSDR
jgi:peroxiredoxin